MRANVAAVPPGHMTLEQRIAARTKSGVLRAATPSPERVRSTPPPSLPSMRVPKGTHVDDDGEAAWREQAALARARLEQEEREWQECMEQAKRALQAAEEIEWRKLAERAAEETRLAEEREWQACIARARMVAAVPPQSHHAAPRRAAVPKRSAPVVAHPRVVAWP
jgi:hypothetical protein